MKLFYWLVKLAVLAVLLVFAWINTGSVPFFYLPGQSAALPLIVVLFGAFFAGALFGLFALFGRLVRLRNENARLPRCRRVRGWRHRTLLRPCCRKRRRNKGAAWIRLISGGCCSCWW